MGNFQYRLHWELTLNPAIFNGLVDELEMTIPCTNCQRGNRTITFHALQQPGVCRPKEKCGGFPGHLSSREIIKKADRIEVNYLVDFEYVQFEDLKHKVDSSFDFPWARVHFTLKCPNCHREHIMSTQENLVRPRRKTCDCGNVLFTEEKSPFIYEVVEIS